MDEAFKVGDRVRLKSGIRHPGLIAGDTGTIVAVIPASAPSNQAGYHVRLNRSTAGLYATFTAAELEPSK